RYGFSSVKFTVDAGDVAWSVRGSRQFRRHAAKNNWNFWGNDIAVFDDEALCLGTQRHDYFGEITGICFGQIAPRSELISAAGEAGQIEKIGKDIHFGCGF